MEEYAMTIPKRIDDITYQVSNALYQYLWYWMFEPIDKKLKQCLELFVEEQLYSYKDISYITARCYDLDYRPERIKNNDLHVEAIFIYNEQVFLAVFKFSSYYVGAYSISCHKEICKPI
jgi:hypothetical protein